MVRPLTEPELDCRLDRGVPDPLGMLAAAGQEMDGAAVKHEPQLDRPGLAAAAPDGGQPGIRLVARAGLDLDRRDGYPCAAAFNSVVVGSIDFPRRTAFRRIQASGIGRNQ